MIYTHTNFISLYTYIVYIGLYTHTCTHALELFYCMNYFSLNRTYTYNRAHMRMHARTHPRLGLWCSTEDFVWYVTVLCIWSASRVCRFPHANPSTWKGNLSPGRSRCSTWAPELQWKNDFHLKQGYRPSSQTISHALVQQLPGYPHRRLPLSSLSACDLSLCGNTWWSLYRPQTSVGWSGFNDVPSVPYLCLRLSSEIT